jgi:hypothetical protein
MAKKKGPSGEMQKITFGKKKLGKARKAYNKHDRTEKTYRGQGR